MTDQNGIIQKTEEPETQRPSDGKTLLSWLYGGRRYILGALLGVAAACLIIWLGFWKTALIVAMAALGAFVFGVDDKTAWLKNAVNKLFPPRS